MILFVYSIRNDQIVGQFFTIHDVRKHVLRIAICDHFGSPRDALGTSALNSRRMRFQRLSMVTDARSLPTRKQT